MADPTPVRGPRSSLIIVLALALASCGGEATEPPPGSQLAGVTWIMDRASVLELEADAPVGAIGSIRFEGGEVGGTAFCNLYGGTYVLDGRLLSIQIGAMTEMACEEPLMNMESALVGFLGSVTSYRLEGSSLVLASGDLRLTFVPEQTVPLVGTRWLFDGLVDGDTVSSMIASTEPFLRFDPDGGVSGDAGCNSFSGDYSLDGARLSFGLLATTRMSCEGPGVMDQERRIIEALGATASHEIEGSALSLQDAEGRVVLTLVAA